MQATTPPPQPGQTPPPQAGYPPYGYAQPGPATSSIPTINRRLVFLIIGLGILLIWIAQIGIRAFDIRDGALNALQALAYTGAMFGMGGAVLGALGSPKTDGWQNLGLLLLAGFFLTALLHGF